MPVDLRANGLSSAFYFFFFTATEHFNSKWNDFTHIPTERTEWSKHIFLRSTTETHSSSRTHAELFKCTLLVCCRFFISFVSWLMGLYGFESERKMEILCSMKIIKKRKPVRQSHECRQYNELSTALFCSQQHKLYIYIQYMYMLSPLSTNYWYLLGVVCGRLHRH